MSEKTYVCRVCGKPKSISGFYTHKYKTRDGIKICPRSLVCKKCYADYYGTRPKQNQRSREKYRKDKEYRESRKEWAREYWRKNREKCLAKHKDWYEKNRDKILVKMHTETIQERAELIRKLGGKCQNPECGIEDIDVLEFDHIKPLNSAKRKYGNILREVKKHPERFQLLCANCHRRKTLNEFEKRWEERQRKMQMSLLRKS